MATSSRAGLCRGVCILLVISKPSILILSSSLCTLPNALYPPPSFFSSSLASSPTSCLSTTMMTWGGGTSYSVLICIYCSGKSPTVASSFEGLECITSLIVSVWGSSRGGEEGGSEGGTGTWGGSGRVEAGGGSEERTKRVVEPLMILDF